MMMIFTVPTAAGMATPGAVTTWDPVMVVVMAWGPGMMRERRGYQQPPSEACQKFLNETAGLRKELYMKRYDYYEGMNDPETKPETLSKMEKEVLDLRQKIRDKNPSSCWY